MFLESEQSTAVLATTRSAFEAETIAAALRDRGFAAQAVDTASTQLWSGAIGGAKVLVYERELESAREELRRIRSEGAAVDWDSAELGESFDEDRPNSRFTWTSVLLLVLLGLGLLSFGGKRLDPVIQGIGAVAILLAMVIGGVAWVTDSRRGRR